MSDAQRNSVGPSTTLKSQSPKSQSSNESTPVVDYSSTREQKKSEERRKCKKKDDDYLTMREEILSLAKAMHRKDAVRIKIWLTKLDETLSLLTWKNNRNQHAALMIKQLRLGSLGDFFSRIPSGHLGNLPSHLKQMALSNDDASKKESDNQKMSPLVASFMPSQASNPFFRLTESEIPASPCSESAGSESSQTNEHHVARRVSFSPRDAASLFKSSPAHSQVSLGAQIAPVLKSAAVSNLHVEQVAGNWRLENSRSAFAHDQSKFSQQNQPQFVGKPLSDSAVIRNSANSGQIKAGVPNSLSPGLAVSKPQTSNSSATFAAATYSSPHLHSPTPRPRFSNHDGIASMSHHWASKRTTPEKKDVVNGVSCSPPSLMRVTTRKQESHTSSPVTSMLHFEDALRDSRFSVESVRNSISRLHLLQEPHSHSPMKP